LDLGARGGVGGVGEEDGEKERKNETTCVHFLRNHSILVPNQKKTQ